MLGRSLPITRVNPNFVHWQLYNTTLLHKNQVILHVLSYNNDIKEPGYLLKNQCYINLSEIDTRILRAMMHKLNED